MSQTSTQRILITGGASGIGRMASERYAKAGAQIIAVDVNAKGLAETQALHENIQTRELNITDHKAVQQCIDEIESQHGAIDKLIHCAAIMPLDLIETQSVETMHAMIDINVKGTININKALLPYFLKREKGVIVNFASIAGWIPCMYFGVYDASKAAVVSFSEVLHHEVRNKGIHVCCVCPPPVKTPMLLEANIQPKILDEMEKVVPEQVLNAM